MISIVLSVVMAMFVGAALSLGPAHLGAGALTINQLDAQRAAESGVEYGLSQLRKNPDWRGNENRITVNSPDLFVQEDNGNVVGLVRTPSGEWSQFKIRFNYQDGSGNGDGLDDPTLLRVDNPFVSVNNLRGGVPAEVPRADGAGWSVTSTSRRPYTCPLWSACLAVEGRAGQLDATPANPLGSPGRGTVRTVETLCQVPDMGELVDDAGTMAAREMQVSLPPGKDHAVTVTSKDKGRLASVRSKASINVSGGDTVNYVSSGEVATSDRTLNARYTSGLSLRQEKPIDPFYQLAWDQVKTANPAGKTLDAGVYVWWEQDKALHYYDMNYADYVQHIRNNPTDPGVPAVLPSSIKPTSNYDLQIVESTYVKATATTDDLSIITRTGAPLDVPPPPAAGGRAATDSIAGDVMASGDLVPVLTSTNQANNGQLDVIDSATGQPVFSLAWDNLDGQLADPQARFSPVGNVSEYDATRFFLDPSLYPKWQIASTSTGYVQASSTVTMNAASTMRVKSGAAPGTINPPGISDQVDASDLKIEFKGDQSLVVLSSPGDLRLTGAVTGKGGSMTAAGDIRLVGVGSGQLASLPTGDQGDGVNLYASGNVFLNSMTAKNGTYGFRDVHFKGVIYTWGNFSAHLASPAVRDAGSLKLEGTLIAYGGDPKQAPGSNGRGAVSVQAREVDLKFDPSYLGGLSQVLPANFQLKPISWNTDLKP